MSKAILVIDMPNSCMDCPLFVTSDYGAYCVLDDTRSDKASGCPLQQAPEEELVWFDDERGDWERGYNSCLREIVGREEEFEEEENYEDFRND